MSESNSNTLNDQTSFQGGVKFSGNLEEQLVHAINSFRFKSKGMIQQLKQLLTNEVNREEKVLTLKEINKTITYRDDSLIQRLENYLNDIDVVNQILPDFSCNHRFNENFKKAVGSLEISLSDSKTQEKLSKSLKSNIFYSYNVLEVPWTNMEQLIMLIVIEEFLQLNDPTFQVTNIDEFFSLNICKSSHPVHNSQSIQDCYHRLIHQQVLEFKKKSSQASAIDGSQQSIPSNKVYNVFILLSSSDYFTDLNSATQKTISKQKVGRYIQISLQDINQNTTSYKSSSSASQKKQRDWAIVPQKYNNMIHRTTQIPRLSIVRLIEKMDTNNDGLITPDDIVKFSEKAYLYFDQALAQEMFQEAADKRIVVSKKQYETPLNVDEILSAVTMHYTLDEQHRWQERPRPYRDKWILLLQAAGENPPTKHDLSIIKVDKVKDMHELPPYTFKPKLNESKSLIIIRPKPQPSYVRPFRPEAGIIINNTENVREVIVDQTNSELKVDPFEKIVNSKFKQNNFPSESEYPTIKFDTREYYQEAERLSKNPELYLKGRNPILTFHPEQSYHQQKYSELLPANKKLSLVNRFSKGLSNLQSPDLHESVFFKEIDELQEYEDIESITLLQEQNWQTRQKRQTSQPSFRNLPSLIQNQTIKQQQKLTHNKQAENLEEGEKPKPIMVTTFKIEDCRTLKAKLASKEPVTDQYQPPSAHQFRSEYVHPQSKPIFKTRIKVEELQNPHGMSDHDQRPQFTIEKELREKKYQEYMEKRKLDEQLGIFVQQKDWINYFPLADRLHNMVDQKRPDFLDKGDYQDHTQILSTLLRGESDFEQPFKLFHRQLRKDDKNLFLGQVKDSKF